MRVSCGSWEMVWKTSNNENKNTGTPPRPLSLIFHFGVDSLPLAAIFTAWGWPLASVGKLKLHIDASNFFKGLHVAGNVMDTSSRKRANGA